MRAHTLEVPLSFELRRETRDIESELLGVSAQVSRLELRLVFEQQPMHLPELSLYPGALGGLGCGECIGMCIHNWEVPVSETNIASEFPEQHLDGSDGLFA